MPSLLHYNACSHRCFPRLHAQAIFPSQYCAVLRCCHIFPAMCFYLLTSLSFGSINFSLFTYLLRHLPKQCNHEIAGVNPGWSSVETHVYLIRRRDSCGSEWCARCTFVNRHSCGPVFCVNFSARKENHNACSAHEHFVLISIRADFVQCNKVVLCLSWNKIEMSWIWHDYALFLLLEVKHTNCASII